jgi:hypothetical protein
MALNERIASLDAPLQVDPSRTIGDVIPDEQLLDPDELLQSNEIGDLLVRWLAQLGDKQQEVLQRRYGLGGNRALHARGDRPRHEPDARAGAPDPDRSARSVAAHHPARRRHRRQPALTGTAVDQRASASLLCAVA